MLTQSQMSTSYSGRLDHEIFPPADCQERFRSGECDDIRQIEYALNIAPLDLWFLLFRLGGLPISDTAYRILQVGASAAIAAFCLYGRWKQWPKARLLGG